MKCSVDYSISIYPQWSGSLHQILYTIGSRSPHTKRIGRNWMAPLSSLTCFTPPSREQKLRPTRIRDRFMALVHCRECGEMISESAPTCPKCGARQGLTSSGSSFASEDKDPSVGLNVVSFLWPLVGLILYLVYHDKSPRRAKDCGKWALIGLAVSVVIGIIAAIIIGAAAASAVSYY